LFSHPPILVLDWRSLQKSRRRCLQEKKFEKKTRERLISQLFPSTSCTSLDVRKWSQLKHKKSFKRVIIEIYGNIIQTRHHRDIQ
jgi:hypothetical protein